MKYTIEIPSYERLQNILATKQYELSGWSVVAPAYVTDVRVFSINGEDIALMYCYLKDKVENTIVMTHFEVALNHRDQGHGKKIIKRFIDKYKGFRFEICEPYEDVIPFWEKCGFIDNVYQGEK